MAAERGGGAPLVTTVGHGTVEAEELAGLLLQAGVRALVDVRSYPGSRRHPQFGRDRMEEWLPAAGVSYRWARDLGGFRRPRPDSSNPALRHPSFRGYADYMEEPEFSAAFDELVDQARKEPVAVMCSESLWWRCHRRLLSDALVLWSGCEVVHLGHDGRLTPHKLTDGVRAGPGGRPVYDVGVTGRLDV